LFLPVGRHHLGVTETGLSVNEVIRFLGRSASEQS
jgi:hypothetical protein